MQQLGRLAHAQLVEGDLASEVADLCGLQRVERSGLDCDQQTKCGVEGAGVALGLRRGQHPSRTTSRRRCQRGRAFQKRCGCRYPSSGQCPVGGVLEFHGDGLVGPERGLSAMPGPPVRIYPWIGGRGQRPVCPLFLGLGRRPVRRGANQRMAELNTGADVDQPCLDRRFRGLGIDPESRRGVP